MFEIYGGDKEKVQRSERVFFWIMTLVVIFFVVQNIVYIHWDDRPQYTDYHYIRAIKFYNYLTGKTDDALAAELQYPPMTYLVTFPFFKLMGVSLKTARLSLAFFWIIFAVSMYGIGYEFGGRWSGAAVSILALSSPHLLTCSRVYFIDFPQTAMCAAAFYMLLKSEYFKNRIYSIFFGILLGLAFLTKWSALIFLSMPVIWFILPSVFKIRKTVKILLVLIVLGLFYIVGVKTYFNNVMRATIWAHSQWPFYFSLFVILPFDAYLLIHYFFEKGIKKEKTSLSGPDVKFLNFSLSMAIALFLASLWIFWGAVGFLNKFFSQYHDHFGVLLFGDRKFEVRYLSTLFNLASLLYIAGLYYLFYKHRADYKHSIIPVNILFITVLMLFWGYPLPRIHLPLIIFAATLGCYWISQLKKGKKAMIYLLTVLMTVVSLSWLIFPGSPDFVYVHMPNSLPYDTLHCASRLQVPQPPCRMRVDQVFTVIKKQSPITATVYIINRTSLRDDRSLSTESFLAYVRRYDKKRIYISTLDSVFFISHRDMRFHTSYSALPSKCMPEEVGPEDFFVLIHPYNERPSDDIGRLTSRYRRYYKSYKIDVGEGQAATIIQFYKKERK